MPIPPEPERVQPQAILRLILYFDVFEHPLSEAELVGWCGPGALAAIRDLLGSGRLLAHADRLCLPGRQGLAARRRERSAAAERLWPTAYRAAWFLAQFPWIRGILVTGGLSKNSVASDADVDFLLLVAPQRVWLAKSAIQLLRRALPEAGREALCANYILSTDALEIPVDQRDVYAAVEIVTARPLYGPEACRRLFEANRWVGEWFPAFDPAVGGMARRIRAPHRRWAAADRLDTLARHAWDRYWGSKYDHLSKEELGLRFRRDPDVSTNHLDDWRAPVLAQWRDRLKAHGIPELE